MTATLFGLALLTYAARTYIRTFIVRQVFVEDGLLLFAVICLCVVTVLDLKDTQLLYDSHGPDLALLMRTLAEIPETARRTKAAPVLWWCVVFPAKLAFLFFFRRLIVRLPTLYMWWWCALAITLLSWVASTIAEILICSSVSLHLALCRWPSPLNHHY